MLHSHGASDGKDEKGALPSCCSPSLSPINAGSSLFGKKPPQTKYVEVIVASEQEQKERAAEVEKLVQEAMKVNPLCLFCNLAFSC